MAEDKIDKAIIDFFAALKELGELRRRYDSLVGNTTDLIKDLGVLMYHELKMGYLHLAKTRYSMGAGSVSKLQYDATMTPNSVVDVVSNSDHSDEEELISFVHAEPDSLSNNESISDKETHLRRRLVDEKQVETIGQSKATSKTAKDPLKWFGLLVPPSLRTAQRNFKEAIEISCQLASAQAKVEHYRNLYLTLIKNRSK